VRVQNLPEPPKPAAAPAVVCEPLALSTSYSQRTHTQNFGADTLRIYSSDERQDHYGNYSANSSKLIFDPRIPDAIAFRFRSMSLTDRRGLLQYLWLKDNAFKLTYHPHVQQ
jgi:hypothetical protein